MMDEARMKSGGRVDICSVRVVHIHLKRSAGQNVITGPRAGGANSIEVPGFARCSI